MSITDQPTEDTAADPAVAVPALDEQAPIPETGRDPGSRIESDDEAPDVSILVKQFHADTGYPTEAHEKQKRLREEWALKLAPDTSSLSAALI